MAHECEQCGQEIRINQDYLASAPHKMRLFGKEFCSVDCLKEFLRNNMLDEVLDDWIDENMEEYTMEADDPYDRYGVYPEDFH